MNKNVTNRTCEVKHHRHSRKSSAGSFILFTCYLQGEMSTCKSCFYQFSQWPGTSSCPHSTVYSPGGQIQGSQLHGDQTARVPELELRTLRFPRTPQPHSYWWSVRKWMVFLFIFQRSDLPHLHVKKMFSSKIKCLSFSYSSLNAWHSCFPYL